MNHALHALWTPLLLTPLLWLTLTLVAYLIGRGVQKLSHGSAFANPVLIAIVIVAATLLSTGTGYATYSSGAQFINFLLGPATIALAVPLASNLTRVRQVLPGIGVALLAGSCTSIVSGIVIVELLGGTHEVAMSMAPKAVTTPIAMAVSQEIGGLPSLTAVLAILGGVVAAIAGQHILRRLRVDDWRAHGLAAGVAGSGVAAAQVAGRNQLGAAFAALGIGLNGLLTALIVPLLAKFWN